MDKTFCWTGVGVVVGNGLLGQLGYGNPTFGHLLTVALFYAVFALIVRQVARTVGKKQSTSPGRSAVEKV
jgi:hypothetical protein